MTPSPADQAKDAGWLTAIMAALAIMGLYLFMTTRTTLWDRDEPRYARVTVEMVQSNNYMVPTFNGESWLDKPVLMYWLMSLPVRIFGPTEFACRFFSAIGISLTCFLTFVIGKRLFDVRTGLCSMVILSSTFMILGIGTAAVADALVLPFVVGVMMIFVKARDTGMHIYDVVLMGIVLGLGMLTKGPIGFLPVPVIICVLWLNRKTDINLKPTLFKVSIAVVVGFIILLAWAIPVNNYTHGEFVSVFLGHHVLARALKPMEHHGGNILLYLPYYIPVILAGFFPWTMYLPGSISALLGNRLGGKYGRNLLMGWIVPIVVVMTLAATKLPHYILFIWPALALASAGTIEAFRKNQLSEGDRIWLRRGSWFFGPIAICGALALMIGPWFLPIDGLQVPSLVSGLVFLIMALSAIYLQSGNRFQASALVLLIGMVVFHIPYLFGVLPAIERIKIAPQIAAALKDQTSENTPIITYKFGEPTLNFYIGRHIDSLASANDVVEWAKRRQSGVLIIPADELVSIEEENGPLNLHQIAAVKGMNYSKGYFLELLALSGGQRKND